MALDLLTSIFYGNTFATDVAHSFNRFEHYDEIGLAYFLEPTMTFAEIRKASIDFGGCRTLRPQVFIFYSKFLDLSTSLNFLPPSSLLVFLL